MTMILDGSAGVTFPNSTVQASAGSVIQVVNATYSTQASTTSTSFVDTGLTATITPKFSTSKILVMYEINGTYSSLAAGTQVNLCRGSTQLIINEKITSRVGLGTTDAGTGTSGATYLDSPATTSATTYKCQFSTNTGSTAYAQFSSSVSTITLMEIAQ